MRRFFLAVFSLLVLAAAAAVGGGLWWVNQPLRLSAPTLDLSIEPGTLPRGVAQAVKDAGVDVQPELLFLWFRLSGRSRAIKAGSYELETGITPKILLSKLARGEESLRAVTLVEGWTFRQARAALAKEETLKPDTRDMSDEAIMNLLGRTGQRPEGRFFPDTYTYAKGSSDLAVLRRAMRAMDKRLAEAWAQRLPQAVAKTPDEALILASIIEKETGRASDRALVASVFNNRLRVGMPLQTDPTAIYARRICRPTPRGTPTRAPACRPRRSPCRAGRPCWPPCNRRRALRCTSWHAATAAASSATRWMHTTAPSTNTSASNDTGAFHQL